MDRSQDPQSEENPYSSAGGLIPASEEQIADQSQALPPAVIEDSQVPAVIPDNKVAQVSNDVSKTVSVPAQAEDNDLIEKEWVDRAKEIVTIQDMTLTSSKEQ